MSNKKTEFKYFTIPQYRQGENYLSSMHEKGWKLTGITMPGFYHFEKCEPAKVTYRLDYNQEAVSNKAEYVKIFSDCGWDYLFDFVGYSYFCKKDSLSGEREEIFCDDASRLDMMKRVFKGRVWPLIILFFGVILPQLCMNVVGYGRGGIVQDVLSVVFLVIAGLYLVLFAVMSFQFYQYEKFVSPENSGTLYKYAGIFTILLAIAVGIGFFFHFFNS